MKISVIIRNRDEEKHIGYCLQSVVDCLAEDLQIILVDNCSEDNSIRIVNTFDYLDVDKIEVSKNDYTPGKALNLGVKKATGDVILIISAHCEIIEFSLVQAINDLQENIAVWGKQIPIFDGKKISRRYMWANFQDESSINYFCKFENRYFFHNAFSLFKRESLLKFPFNEDLIGKEDRMWANERIEEGHDIKYESNFTAKHHYTVNGATWTGTG